MSNQTTLRELAKGYARGVLDKDKYRKSRTELINGIIEGTVSLETIDYAPPLMPSEDDDVITETAQREKRDTNKTEIMPEGSRRQKSAKQQQAQVTANAKPASKKAPLIFASASAAVIIILIVLVVLFYPKPPGSETDKNTISTDITASEETKPETSTMHMAGEKLLADFLNQKNWSNEHLDQFVVSWSSLNDAERETASQTKRMQRMNDSIYKQFLEEKALASIDSDKALAKQQKLIEFAEALGLNDTRLTIE